MASEIEILMREPITEDEIKEVEDHIHHMTREIQTGKYAGGIPRLLILAGKMVREIKRIRMESECWKGVAKTSPTIDPLEHRRSMVAKSYRPRMVQEVMNDD